MRLLVAYLGEQKRAAWWNTNFLDETGVRFLESTFPRTARLATIRSASDAARSVHDRALGRASTYHLFRLPPGLEDQLENVIAHLDWPVTWLLVSTQEAAMERLKLLADSYIQAPEGPVQVGVESRILTPTSIKEVAAHYHSAFSNGICCFPYFAKD